MRRIAPNAVVIGGHSRNIGKTSVMAGLIRGLAPLGWTAVKITQYGHGICSLGGEPCGCAPTEHSFVLTEEGDAGGRGDTCRFLAAGALRSLWLRVRQGQLAHAFPALERELDRNDWVMIESNSVMEFIEPRAFVMVMDAAELDFKPSAARFLERADAVVSIGGKLCMRAWAALDARMPEGAPCYTMARGHYNSPQLCRFIRQKLGRPQAHALAAAESRMAGRKEHTWRH